MSTSSASRKGRLACARRCRSGNWISPCPMPLAVAVPCTMPGFHVGRPPPNKGLRSPADPPPVEEIVAAMRSAGKGPHGDRLRALIVVLWRAGLRIHEGSLTEGHLDRRRGSLLVRRG